MAEADTILEIAPFYIDYLVQATAPRTAPSLTTLARTVRNAELGICPDRTEHDEKAVGLLLPPSPV